ncbi:MAG TPA: porin family protein, partial [Phnomibacter sp.]|nr:porin family protein [Phnomibacter sp.]
MKKILAFSLLLFVSLVGNAQWLKVGPKFGANLQKIDGKDFDEAFQLGYYLGGFAEIGLGKKFYLQPEVLFAETRMNTATEFTSIYRDLLKVDTLRSIKFQSLAIPITLNWRIANILSLSAGPQFSINMNKGESFMRNAEAAITNGDIAMMLGANVMLSKFRVNGRYMWGLKDQSAMEGGNSWKRQTIQLGV